jgi:hypothetical protein
MDTCLRLSKFPERHFKAIFGSDRGGYEGSGSPQSPKTSLPTLTLELGPCSFVFLRPTGSERALVRLLSNDPRNGVSPVHEAEYGWWHALTHAQRRPASTEDGFAELSINGHSFSARELEQLRTWLEEFAEEYGDWQISHQQTA